MADQATGPTGHSSFGMSVLERRISCPGSANAEKGKRDRPGAAADRGTMLHEAAAKALISGVEADDLAELEGDEDGQAIVQAYLGQVRATHAQMGGRLLVEQQFHLKSLSPLLWGTADAVILAPPRMAVLDLKTGGHLVPVSRPQGGPNLQLAGYGLGALDSLPAGSGAVEEVTLTIVQPRLGMANSITVDVVELYDLAVDLVDAVEAAADPDAPLVPGDHCRYCKAAATCSALQAVVQAAARADFDADPVDPAELSPEELGQVLDRAELLDVWIGAVRQYARQEADRGRMPAGYKLVKRRGRRRWRQGVEESAARLLVNVGLAAPAIYTAPQLRSPAQCEGLLKAAKITPPSAPVWDGMIETSDPGIALVVATDPRPAIEAGPAADFDDETVEVDPFS